MKNTIRKKIPVLFSRPKKNPSVFHRPKKIPLGQNVRPKKILRTPRSLKYVSGVPGPLTLSNSVKARECSPAILGVYVCYIFKICSLNVDINYVIVTVMKNIVLHHYSRVVMMVQFLQDSIVWQCFSVTSIS